MGLEMKVLCAVPQVRMRAVERTGRRADDTAAGLMLRIHNFKAKRAERQPNTAKGIRKHKTCEYQPQRLGANVPEMSSSVLSLPVHSSSIGRQSDSDTNSDRLNQMS